MFELVVVLALICVLLVIKIAFDRLDKEKVEEGKPDKEAEQNKPRDFKGVIITPGDNCCHSVLLMEGKTFTAEDKITLPLPGCSQEKCGCERTVITERRKRHRRQIADRRAAIRFEPDFKDRRQKSGRRKEDDNTFTGGYRH